MRQHALPSARSQNYRYENWQFAQINPVAPTARIGAFENHQARTNHQELKTLPQDNFERFCKFLGDALVHVQKSSYVCTRWNLRWQIARDVGETEKKKKTEYEQTNNFPDEFFASKRETYPLFIVGNWRHQNGHIAEIPISHFANLGTWTLALWPCWYHKAQKKKHGTFSVCKHRTQ